MYVSWVPLIVPLFLHSVIIWLSACRLSGENKNVCKRETATKNGLNYLLADTPQKQHAEYAACPRTVGGSFPIPGNQSAYASARRERAQGFCGCIYY